MTTLTLTVAPVSSFAFTADLVCAVPPALTQAASSARTVITPASTPMRNPFFFMPSLPRLNYVTPSGVPVLTLG
jgi:hypothetical protein